MVKKSSVNFDSIKEKLAVQFSNLDPKDPSAWPAVPLYALCLVIVAGVVLLGWLVFLSNFQTDLDAAMASETSLKQDYVEKYKKAVNLEELTSQRSQIQFYVIELENQLPNKAEMPALLSDVNQSGLGRSLQFDLFRPGQVAVKNYYAELPIAIRVTGRYHDMASFVSDVAHLSRIVTLNNILIAPGKDGFLVMDTEARTFRYLDEKEQSTQAKGDGK